jgi:hypothetical protein
MKNTTAGIIEITIMESMEIIISVFPGLGYGRFASAF